MGVVTKGITGRKVPPASEDPLTGKKEVPERLKTPAGPSDGRCGGSTLPLHFHFADLNDGLDVGVVGNVCQDCLCMGPERSLECVDGIERQMANGDIRHGSTRRSASQALFDGNALESWPYLLTGHGDVLLQVVSHVKFCAFAVWVKYADLDHSCIPPCFSCGLINHPMHLMESPAAAEFARRHWPSIAPRAPVRKKNGAAAMVRAGAALRDGPACRNPCSVRVRIEDIAGRIPPCDGHDRPSPESTLRQWKQSARRRGSMLFARSGGRARSHQAEDNPETD